MIYQYYYLINNAKIQIMDDLNNLNMKPIRSKPYIQIYLSNNFDVKESPLLWSTKKFGEILKK